MTDLSKANPSVIFDFNILIANITKLSRSQGQVILTNLKKAILDALSSTEKWKKNFATYLLMGKP